MPSKVGNKGVPQQLTSVTAGAWTTLFDPGADWLNSVIPKIWIQNTGADDITVSLRMTSLDMGDGVYEGDFLTNVKIAGSNRRSGLLNNIPGSNPINFSHDMAPNVDGLQPGGHDSHSFEDFNGLTYSGRVDIDFFQSYTVESVIKLEFKCDKASGFIATLLPSNATPMKTIVSKAGTGTTY